MMVAQPSVMRMGSRGALTAHTCARGLAIGLLATEGPVDDSSGLDRVALYHAALITCREEYRAAANLRAGELGTRGRSRAPPGRALG